MKNNCCTIKYDTSIVYKLIFNGLERTLFTLTKNKQFLPCDATQSAVMRLYVRLSVCLSAVRPSVTF